MIVIRNKLYDKENWCLYLEILEFFYFFMVIYRELVEIYVYWIVFCEKKVKW